MMNVSICFDSQTHAVVIKIRGRIARLNDLISSFLHAIDLSKT